MKTLFLVRHAKSSWKHPELKDFDRPLNKRGKHDAPFMGKLLLDLGVQPDLMVTSTANRALTTAKVVAKALNYPKGRLLKDPGIYHASEDELLKIVQQIPAKVNSLMLFGHNPGFTWFCNLLSDAELDNIPTTGAVQLSFPVDSWADIGPGIGTLDWFEYPKKHQH